MVKLRKIYETLQLKMKLTTGDSKRSIFKDVKNLFSTDLSLYDKNCIATRIEKMTHLIKDRKFSYYREMLRAKKQDFFINVVDLDNINIDKINYILKKWSSDKDLNEYHSTVKFLEDEINEKTDTLKKMKRNELDRICKEYFKNDYERRFKVPIETMLSALVGEENLLYEVSNYKRMLRVIKL